MRRTGGSDYCLTIVLYYLEGYSVEEIAGIMRIPAGTVKSRLSRGRRDLRCIMERQDFALRCRVREKAQQSGCARHREVVLHEQHSKK